jgi:hypothetical protein
MKITFNLTEAQIKGIKAYIKETSGIEKPTKQDIQQELQGEIVALLQSPQSAMADYIRQFENQ